MPARHRDPRSHDRRLLPALIAAALVLGLALNGAEVEASASIGAAGSGTTADPSDHGHACKCRMHCKTTCCCAPDETTAIPAPATPEPAATGPCVTAVPCGGAAVPGAAPGVQAGAKAAPWAAMMVRPATAGILISTPPSTPPPPSAPAWIDEPPETLGCA